MDRNKSAKGLIATNAASLSARRAWIEMVVLMLQKAISTSLSARRAWIEILYQLYDTYAKVSLSARRAWIEISRQVCLICRVDCRSPQGERG